MIAVCPNPFRDIGLELTNKACALLHEAGFETAVCPVFAEDDPDILPEGLKAQKLSDVVKTCSLCVVIGGDGTILSVARQLNTLHVPILGVNLGTKGFMTALEPEDLPRIVDAARGEYKLSRRMMLEAALQRKGEIVCRGHVLNDVVLHGYGDCIRMTAWCDGDIVTSFSGDGIILSTPTGSTGYSMSAGGPIVEPSAESILLSPICAHMMGAKSFVLSPNRTVKVLTEKLHGRRAYLSLDGNSAADLENGDLLLVAKSEHYTMMADLGLKSFYEIAYQKLN